MNWTDKDKRRAVSLYLNEQPTAQNTTSVVRYVAEEMETSPNSVRCIY